MKSTAAAPPDRWRRRLLSPLSGPGDDGVVVPCCSRLAPRPQQAMMSRGVRVMVSRPSPQRRPVVKPNACILSMPSHSFVDSDAVPSRKQRAAHSHRADRARFRLPAGAAGLDRQPLEPRRRQQRGAAGRGQRAERAARRARSRARRVRHDATTAATARNDPRAPARAHRAGIAPDRSPRRWPSRWRLGARPLALVRRATRPSLLLLTSLPLVFSEDFSLEGGGSPALDGAGDSAIAWFRSASPTAPSSPRAGCC